MKVRTHIRLDRVTSTNDFAQFLVSRAKPAEGTVISAIDQYAGRGQAGSNWHASPGKNVTASFILYPGFIPVRDQFRLNKLFAVSALHFFSQFLTRSRMVIKWPNDLLIDGQKAAGLLIRVATTREKIRHAVLGLGVNIFEENFPDDIPNPVALSRYCGSLPGVPDLVDGFQQRFCADYGRMRDGNYGGLDMEYTRNLFGVDQPLMFTERDAGAFEGVIRGVDAFGRLEIMTAGRIRAFQTGDLVFHHFRKGN